MNVVNHDNRSLVYDFGTSSIKFGYGGDCRPLFSIPPASGQRIRDGLVQPQFGEEWLHRKVPGIDVVTMIDPEGIILDCETISSFLDWTYTACFGEIDPSEWSVLFSQPSVHLLYPDRFRARREIIAEAAFGFAMHPSISFQHDSVLSCYSHAIHTGVVVDFGTSCVRVVPVLEGHPLRRAIQVHPLGGFKLSDILKQLMSEKGKVVRTALDPKSTDGFGGLFAPPPIITTPTRSQLDFCRRGVLIDMIKSHLRFDEKPDETILDYVYYMAGREPVDIEAEIKQLSRLLFQSSDNQPSLQELIKLAIQNAPIELRDSFWHSIVTCGGLSKLKGFQSVLEQSLKTVAPKHVRPRVVPAMAQEASGATSVWVGGSIIASYQGFKDICITSHEWRECGPSILERKCL